MYYNIAILKMLLLFTVFSGENTVFLAIFLNIFNKNCPACSLQAKISNKIAFVDNKLHNMLYF